MKVKLQIHSRFKARIVGKVRDAAARAMVHTTTFAIDTISRIADAKLHKTAKLYKQALPAAITVSGSTMTIALTGAAKDLETGYPARDMKPAMLASPSAKTAADGGRYADVSFRHATKTTATRFAGMPSEIKARVQASVNAERTAAQNEGRAERNPLRVTGSMPGSVNEQQRYNKKGGTRQVDVQHKTSIYSDMLKTAKAAGGSTYNTIRRISENSDPQAWYHPGFEGIRALKQAESEIRAKLTQFFKRELRSKGMKTK